MGLRQTEGVAETPTTPVPVDPRIERTQRVVLGATIALLSEGGYAAVTIEAVAARSGVAKSTIYRHWPSRIELIHDAFHELKPPVPSAGVGDIREQVIVLLEDLARNVAASTWSSCLPTLIDAAERDPEARELHCGLARAGKQAMVEMLEEGKRRGEFPATLDAELMTEALGGPILIRRLFLAEPFDPANVRHLVDQLLPCSPAIPSAKNTKRVKAAKAV